jgi:23S rRNA pseudouridine2605 synthase
VQQGKVRVNGQDVKEPTRILVSGDEVEVLGQFFRFAPLENKNLNRSFLYHKPAGLLCSHGDPWGRKTIFDQLETLVKSCAPRQLLYAGRLDAESRGLMILSTDGDFIQKVAHPSAGLDKEYLVTVHRPIDLRRIEDICKGTTWKGITYAPFTFQKGEGETSLRIILQEGKKREIRFLMQSIGYDVIDLLRERIGPYDLKNLGEGAWQEIELPNN